MDRDFSKPTSRRVSADEIPEEVREQLAGIRAAAPNRIWLVVPVAVVERLEDKDAGVTEEFWRVHAYVGGDLDRPVSLFSSRVEVGIDDDARSVSVDFTELMIRVVEETCRIMDMLKGDRDAI